jgi:hypothetical protein
MKKKSKKQSPKRKTGEKAIIASYFLGEKTEKKTGLWWQIRYSQPITIISENDLLSNKNLEWISSEYDDGFPEALRLRLGLLTLDVIYAEVEKKLSRKKTIQNINICRDPFNNKPLIVVEEISSRPRLKEKGDLITVMVKIQYEYETVPVPKPKKSK